jgi:hypothetical protein
LLGSPAANAHQTFQIKSGAGITLSSVPLPRESTAAVSLYEKAGDQILARARRNALAITLTEESAIAAAPIIGERRSRWTRSHEGVPAQFMPDLPTGSLSWNFRMRR